MGGYECSDQLNCFGERANLLETSGHLALLDSDYKDLSQFSIKTVREGIRWSRVEKKPYVYDWSTVIFMFEKAKVNNIQQVWDICHFGYPDDLTPLHPMFTRRFVALCRAFVILYRQYFPTEILVVTPINEVSFISWLGGEKKGTSPYCNGQGWDVKYNLMKAYIAAIAAMKEVDASIRILTTEPLINVIASENATPETKEYTERKNESQYQSLEILSGNMCPELGGKPEYLDILGFNYYFNNQWIADDPTCLNWRERPYDKGWKSLAYLLINCYKRYGKAIVLAETSHAGEFRPEWMAGIGEECSLVLQQGVPLWGVCIYPIIDRTDWDYPEIWHHSGLWDADISGDNEPPGRILDERYADTLLKIQQEIGPLLNKNRRTELLSL